MTTPNVAFIRKEVRDLLPQYRKIRDCLSGEVAVKAAGVIYLPQPNAADNSKENKARYMAYLERAMFYNVSRRTHEGLLGQIFMRAPEQEYPEDLKRVIENATGAGVSFEQVVKKAAAFTLGYSRAGMFVDYPATGGGATKADLDSGRIRPTVYTYGPMEVINWRVIERGAEEVLSLVVLAEGYPGADDGFEIKMCGQFRVLGLDAEGKYYQQVWRQQSPEEWDGLSQLKGGSWLAGEVIYPTGPDGQKLTEIPFHFIGSLNNDSNPDNPNFYDICSVNLAHYRNSADYEESCFIVGQPTPVVTGLTEKWLTDVLKGTLALGSIGGIPLPAGANFELVCAEANTMIKEAMEGKERQMTALGAKLVEQKSVQRTAFEARVDSTAEGSVLASVANNVSDVAQWALKWCLKFMGKKSETEVRYRLNTDFDLAKMTPEDRKQAVSEWQQGAITFTEMRSALKAAGSATEDDDKAKASIEADTKAAMALEAPTNQPGAGAFGNRK